MTPDQGQAQISNDTGHYSQDGKFTVNRLNRGVMVTPLRFRFLIIAVTVCTGISSMAAASCSRGDSTTSTPTPTETPAPTPRSGVTIAKYEKLKTGMRYNEVVEILGAPDREIENRETSGPRTTTCVWGGDQLGSINVIFQNDRLLEKSQYGLQ